MCPPVFSGRFAPLLVALFFFGAAGSAALAQDCLTSGCHAGMQTQDSRHALVQAGECLSCHLVEGTSHPQKGGPTIVLVESGVKLCSQCHEEFGKKRLVHAPAQAGECTACHDPHGGRPALLSVDKGDVRPLCFGCHDEQGFEAQVMHGPAAVGACLECHNPHESNTAALLKQTPVQTCTRCHADMAEGLEQSPVVHTAVRESECTTCHNPHAAPVKKLLKQAQPDLCLGCHPAFGDKLTKSSTRHAPLYREESCGSCHSTHFSDYPALLPAPQQEVCLSCHGKDDNRRSRPLKNMARELEGKSMLHGPVAEGACAACHDPHGSDYFRLLKNAYPEGFYAPFKPDTYALCMDCHDSDMLRFPETSIYTDFRNGKNNLHYVHVADPWKGRSCRACHEPHASNLDKLISEQGAAFGDWRIPTRFQKTDTGGGCTPGCHRSLSYDRDNPVDYQTP
ncbi:MAG: cytochrome c3 family protein [Desulfuromonadales bacterium]|nr:cytochrome c3 family protein [Desulfuromonadales bacterium]MDW7757936.1 cytochrome c3 family protein [Desulfuromonadales bacterium]